MIEALEAVGGDASVLAHHAAAAGDVPRILRYAAGAAAEAARSGAHREAVAFYELAAAPHRRDDAATRADVLEAAVRGAVPHRPARRRDRGAHAGAGAAPRARRRRRGRRRHTGRSPLFAWYAADRRGGRAAGRGGHRDPRPTPATPRALGYALANRAFLAAQRGDLAKALQAGHDAQRIADELGDAALHAAAAIGVAVARLLEGDPAARADLLAASDVGPAAAARRPRHRADEPPRHHDVEQGRFAQAEDVLADALRISEERDIPICTMWQRGVQARLRLLQGRWRRGRAGRARRARRPGTSRWARLWPHLVLGLLAARRDAPAENPHLDELWRLATKLDVPGMLAAGRGRARRAGLDHPPARSPARRSARGGAGRRCPPRAGTTLRRWARRLAARRRAATSSTGAPPTRPRPASEHQPYEQALALWDGGSTDDLLAALPLLDDLDARAVAALVRGRLRELGVTAVPRGRSPVTRANPAGLTARQLDVLALLVEGLSNADIAARLVISRKTADHHVSAILAKLGVRSRGEAVAAARRLGLDAHDTGGPRSTGSSVSPRSTSPSP